MTGARAMTKCTLCVHVGGWGVVRRGGSLCGSAGVAVSWHLARIA